MVAYMQADIDRFGELLDCEETLQILEKALREIAAEDRPYNWCFTCEKWTEAKYASGNSWCPTCGNDLHETSAETRYEQIARAALAKIK